MSHTKENGNGNKSKQETWQQFWKRINVAGLWLLLAFGAILILTVILLAFSTDDIPVRATILAAGIPAVLTFIAVVIQAAVAKQMAEIMERQETETTKQRQAADAMVNLNDKMVTSMQGQLEEMKGQRIALSKQIDLMVKHESAYLSITAWRLKRPADDCIALHGKFVNEGRTPAFNFRRQFQMEIGRGEPPEGVRHIKWKKPTEGSAPSILVKETNFEMRVTNLDPAEIEQIMSETDPAVILFDGECVHSDSSGVGWRWRFGYTCQLKPDIMTVERYQLHEPYVEENDRNE